MQSGDGLIVRVKPSCGMLSLDQAEAIASLSELHGNGIVELTSRGNLQLRGVRSETLEALTAGLDALGLLDASAEAEAVRNIISSPLAGIDRTALDTRPTVQALERALVSAPDLSALSDKFGFSIDGGGQLPLTDVEADIRFVWTGAGFAVGLARDQDAVWIGTCAPGDVTETALTLARSFLIHAQGARRMRLVPDAILHRIAEGTATLSPLSTPTPRATPDQVLAPTGRSSLATSMSAAPDPLLPHSALTPPSTPTPGLSRGPSSQQAGRAAVALPASTLTHPTTGMLGPRDKPEDDREEREDTANSASNRGDVASIQTSAPPNPIGIVISSVDVCAAGIGLPYGGTTAAALGGLVAAARGAGATELRLTPWRAILIAVPGQPAAERVTDAAATLGFITDPADPRRAVAACPGAPACANGSTAVRTDADAFAAAASTLLQDGMSLHVSGCSKGCARRQPASLTLVAEAGRYGLVVNGPASAAACGRFTPQQAAETLARLASAMTKAGDAPDREAAIAAALKEIQAA